MQLPRGEMSWDIVYMRKSIEKDTALQKRQRHG